jgi:cystathionine beta-lyase/cystathionine gamma-synthase
MSEDFKDSKIATRSVHYGERDKRFDNSVTVPIVQSSTFLFTSLKQVQDYTSGTNLHNEYGRYGNTTTRAVEDKMASLEGGEKAVAFDTGMSAVTTTLMALMSSGDHIVLTDDVYKKTLNFCELDLSRFGMATTIVAMGDYQAMEDAIRPETKVIFSETPTNPYLNIADFAKIKDIAKKHNLVTIIDSTFGTPYNQLPLEWGMDLVIHSATKYLAGHNDVLGGFVIGRAELTDKVKNLQKTIGGVCDPHASYLILRGLKTFALRLKHLNECGEKIARYLAGNDRIEEVYYPCLKSHKDYEIAKRQMKGCGSVVTFKLKADLEGTWRFLEALRLIQIGPSLGGVESLITHPAAMTYYRETREERYALGITDNLVRLAAGLEDYEDIIADLERGLATI